MGVDRRNPVVPRVPGPKPGMGIAGVGGAGVVFEVGLPVRRRRHLDPVAGDGGAAVVRGRAPRDHDLRGPVGDRGRLRRVGDGALRRRLVAGGRIRRPHRVDRRNPVVPGVAGRQPGMRIRGVRAGGVGDEVVPAPRAAVVRDLDLVAAHRPPAVVRRRGPGEVDLRVARGRGREPGGLGRRGRLHQAHRRPCRRAASWERWRRYVWFRTGPEDSRGCRTRSCGSARVEVEEPHRRRTGASWIKEKPLTRGPVNRLRLDRDHDGPVRGRRCWESGALGTGTNFQPWTVL